MNNPLLLRWLTFLCCWLYIPFTLYLHSGPQNNFVSIFFGLFYGVNDLFIYKILLAISFVLHFTSLFLRKAPLTILAFILWIISVAIHIENTNGFDHTLILPTQFFFIYVLQNTYRKNFYPLQLFFISWHYFGSALAKIWESGLKWPDGTSFQISIYAWSNPQDFFSGLFMNNHTLAFSAQLLIFILELLFPLIFIKRKEVKIFFGVIFIVFHLINEMIFHYNFWSNIVFLALVLIISPFLKEQEPIREGIS